MSAETSPITQNTAVTFSAQESAAVHRTVKDIRKHGDTLDQMRRIKRLRSWGPVAATSAGLMATYNVYNVFPHPSLTDIPAEIALVLGTATLGSAVRPVARSIERHRTAKKLAANESLSAVAGTQVEVYRERKLGRKKDISLRWYGTAESDQPHVIRGQLSRLAAVGEEAGVTKLVLPYPLVEHYIKEKEAVEIMPQDAWVAASKKRKITDTSHGEDEVVVLSPQELHEVIENIAVVENSEPLHSVMQVLKRVAPRHRANGLYEHYVTNPQQVRERLKRMLKRQIESTAHDTVIVNETVGPFTKKVTHPRTAQVRKDPLRREPEVFLRDMVEWGNVAHTKLLRHKNITVPRLKYVLTHPELFPTAHVREYAEIGAWMILEGYDLGLGKGEGLVVQRSDKVGQKDVGSDNLLQQRIVDQELGEKIPGKRRRRKVKRKERDFNLSKASLGKRALRSAGVVGLGASLGLGLGLGVDQSQADYYQRQIEIIDQKEKDDPLADYETRAKEAQAQTAQEKPIGKLVDDVVNHTVFPFHAFTLDTATELGKMTGVIYTAKDLEKYVSQETQPKDCSLCDAQVGNVTAGPNRPVWYLQPHNGMDTAGYWEKETYNTMDFEGVAWKSSLHYINEAIDESFTRPRTLPHPDTLDKTKPLIQVKRAINFNQGFNDKYETPYTVRTLQDGTQRYVVYTPILRGTHLVAASVGDSKGLGVAEIVLPDGTSVMSFSTVAQGLQQVEYWLAPGDTTPTKAVGPIRPESDITAEKATVIWEKKLGKIIPTDPQERLDFENDYISTNFDYRLSPLPKPKNGYAYTRAEYFDIVFSLKQGNCNIVNTLLILSNPDLLNAVSGYLNKNNPNSQYQYLSGNEAHLFAVDAGGRNYDATPGNVLPEEAAYFEENFQQQMLSDPAAERQQNFFWLAGFGVVALLGSAGYYKRRELTEKYYQADTLRHQLSLKLKSTDALERSFSAFNAELYGGGRWDPESVVLSDDMSGYAAEKEELLEKFDAFAAPDLMAESAALAATASTTPMYERDQRRALRKAQHVIIHLGAIRKNDEKRAAM